MTSGNDKKGPPPRRPAPPAAPQRPAGPTTGGSAARPAPRPAAPPPRPAPRAPVMEADADEKTSAINLADMGLNEDEATVSVDAGAIRARAAAKAAVHEDADEKTTAFNLADLPPEDAEPKRAAQKTLLGHPAPKPGGAAVRGGAAPAGIRRQETQAIAPSMARPAPRAPAPHFDDEKTSALSLDDVEKIDAAPPRPAAKHSPPPQEERTMAMSLDDVDRIDMRPTPQRGGKQAPAHIAQDEKTMAVSLDDIDKIDAAPRRAVGRAAAAMEAAQEEKTTAMSLDDVDKIDGNLAKRKAEAPRAAQAAGKAPQRATAGRATSQTPDGFLGSIAYLFQGDAREARGESVDAGKKAAGLRNLIVVGGAAAALMLVIGFIF